MFGIPDDNNSDYSTGLEILDCSMKMSGAVESPSLRKAVDAIYTLNLSIDRAGMKVNVGTRSMTDPSSSHP